MQAKIKWGIMATGGIAHQMVQSLVDCNEAEVVAVASRSLDRAEQFGSTWNIPRRYESYQALAADSNVDVIYIATPPAFHYDNMLTCLKHGKHILCEKPFTLTAKDADEIFAVAKQKNLFVMEAMWMAFFPAISQAKQWVSEGQVGEIRSIQADFSINVPYDPQHRLYDPKLGGGALLDLGIYPLTFAILFLGFPKKYTSDAQLADTGVDVLDALVLSYENQAMASLICGIVANKPKEAWIVGTEGYIKVHDVFFRPNKLTLCKHGAEPIEHEIPYDSNGYIHEVREVHDCLRAGRLQSDTVSWEHTLKVTELMESIRKQWGVVYPGD